MEINLKAKIPWLEIDINGVFKLEEGTSIGDLLTQLGITDELSNYLIVVNNKIEFISYVIKEGDNVAILPALIGG